MIVILTPRKGLSITGVSSSSNANFLLRAAMQSAVLLLYVVCPCVMLSYGDHVGWNSSKII